MSEKSYFERMLGKALTPNQIKEIVHAVETASALEGMDYLIAQIIRECVNDLDKRLSAIEKQLTTKPKEV